MQTREHVAHVELPLPPDETFALLVTPSAIRAWWSAARAIVVPGEGGAWAAAWGEEEDAPDYVAHATLEVFDPPRRLRFARYRYFARSGPLPFEADLTTEFTVEASATGSVLRVRQAGFPADPIADDFYAACERGWRDTFASISRYARDRVAARGR